MPRRARARADSDIEDALTALESAQAEVGAAIDHLQDFLDDETPVPDHTYRSALIELLQFVTSELDSDPHPWADYFKDGETSRRVAELQGAFYAGLLSDG